MSDIALIRLHTDFTGLVPTTFLIKLEDLPDPAQLNRLKWAFTDPERLKPTQTRAHLTEQAVAQLGALALPLELADLKQLQVLAALDWSAIDPTIAGTLFVRSLDPAPRAQLGAEYTDPPTIMRLVDPVVLDPLRAEWAAVKAAIQRHLDKAQAARSPGARTKATQAAIELYQGVTRSL